MGKITIIAPDNELEKLALGIINNIVSENKISILKGSASQVVKLACREAATGTDVIISRGGNFSFIVGRCRFWQQPDQTRNSQKDGGQSGIRLAPFDG